MSALSIAAICLLLAGYQLKDYRNNKSKLQLSSLICTLLLVVLVLAEAFIKF